MSDQNQLPTPDQVEQVMLEKEAASQKKDDNPLNTHAQLFFLYNPRFQSQLEFLSNKQMIKLMQSLAGSTYNKSEDVSRLASLSNNINKKGLWRVIAAVIEHPLNDAPFSLMSSKEQKLFHHFDSLLTNKYFNCIQAGMEKQAENPEAIRQVEDVIIHTLDTTSKEFTKRTAAEKDSFATANKLLASKFLMLLVTYLEEQERIQKIEKEALETNKLNDEEKTDGQV